MSALELGQINFPPGVDYELYRNSTGDPLNVTVALADIQGTLTLKCEAKTKKLSMSGAISMEVPSGGILTVSHDDPKTMQPARVSLSVVITPSEERD